MHIAEIGTGTRRRAPLPDGPIAEALTSADTSDRLAVVHVELPAGGSMLEHDHGASEIVLIPLSGTVELCQEGKNRTLSAGSTAHIATGERVSLNNPGAEPASLIVVASPPEFAGRLASWPVV
ncbi:cupin domain-containing protein [Streptomyces sp. B21-083]|uniref:cupin domain-containing protein n=1 Tax=Streptomyces sp. B21-083 TaxID=3039410 RepID=UPI002FF2EF8F